MGSIPLPYVTRRATQKPGRRASEMEHLFCAGPLGPRLAGPICTRGAAVFSCGGHMGSPVTTPRFWPLAPATPGENQPRCPGPSSGHPALAVGPATALTTYVGRRPRRAKSKPPLASVGPRCRQPSVATSDGSLGRPRWGPSARLCGVGMKSASLSRLRDGKPHEATIGSRSRPIVESSLFCGENSVLD